MNYSTIIIIAFVACCVQNGIFGQPIDMKWNKPVQICGSQLTDLMIETCKMNDYNPGTTAHDVPTNHREKRKIVDECCDVPCTYRHIYEYYCHLNGNSATELDLLEDLSEPLNNEDTIRTAIDEQISIITSSNTNTTTDSTPATTTTTTTTPATTTTTTTIGSITRFATSTVISVATSTETSINTPSWFEEWMSILIFW